MIFESFPWKRELARNVTVLKTWATKPHTERGGFYVQRSVFLSAFIVRKLMENRKISDAVSNRNIVCNSYHALRPVSDRLSRFLSGSAEDYDLANPRNMSINVYDLVSEIMHSYTFAMVINRRNRCTSFLVNSYRRKDKRLLEITTAAFEKILTDVIRDDVRAISITVDDTSGKISATVTAFTRPRSVRRGPRRRSRPRRAR